MYETNLYHDKDIENEYHIQEITTKFVIYD